MQNMKESRYYRSIAAFQHPIIGFSDRLLDKTEKSYYYMVKKKKRNQ